MAYYSDEALERIRQIVEDEIRRGTRVLSASYLIHAHELEVQQVQRVLTDMANVHYLETHFRVLCSGENERYDVDREFTTLAEIPSGQVTCSKCGDLYAPEDENISVFFEPTDSFVAGLSPKQSPMNGADRTAK
jgi:hypothetical protein